MSRRSDQVAALLQQELGTILMKLELPHLTTISRVEVTPDLKWAKVWITVLTESKADEDAVLAEINSNIYDIQGEINRKLDMKIFPRLRFVIDATQQYAAKINKLIKETHEEE